MSMSSITNRTAAARPPARLALTIPSAGSFGIIDIADLRAEPPPMSLAMPPPPPSTRRPRWPLAGLLTAAAASLTMVGLALAVRTTTPTIVVQQPTALPAPELAMLGAPEPVLQTASDREASSSPRRAGDEPGTDAPAAPEATDEPEAGAPAPTLAPEATTKAKAKAKPRSTASNKRRAKTPAKSPAKSKTPATKDIAVECVLDPSRCTASGTPKASSGPTTKPRPTKLDARQLKAALASTKADARRCGPEHGADPGTRVQVKLSIEGQGGTVVSAVPQGEHASGSLGRCVAVALSRTEFPPFQAPRIGTLYSVRL